ncbi:hypothetical protein Taro_043744 [Colocasia esculenta]|uniref:Uncharacterized protein n=1 Tax=Colocasia esculenta TaxID=4460 RepID=A0A843WSU7_COLES|nr:hypothetical protein [Colocasia esculenta]
MEVLRLVPKQPLGILLTKGIIPLKDNTTPSTPAGLLLFLGQEGSPLLLQVKKPTSWYKRQCSSARLKPLARFYTEYSPSAGHKSFFIKERTKLRVGTNENQLKELSAKRLSPPDYKDAHRESEERRRSLKLEGFKCLNTSSWLGLFLSFLLSVCGV